MELEHSCTSDSSYPSSRVPQYACTVVFVALTTRLDLVTCRSARRIFSACISHVLLLRVCSQPSSSSSALSNDELSKLGKFFAENGSPMPSVERELARQPANLRMASCYSVLGQVAENAMPCGAFANLARPRDPALTHLLLGKTFPINRASALLDNMEPEDAKPMSERIRMVAAIARLGIGQACSPFIPGLPAFLGRTEMQKQRYALAMATRALAVIRAIDEHAYDLSPEQLSDFCTQLFASGEAVLTNPDAKPESVVNGIKRVARREAINRSSAAPPRGQPPVSSASSSSSHSSTSSIFTRMHEICKRWNRNRK